MTIIGGIITAILGVFFAHDILELLGTDPKVTLDFLYILRTPCLPY
jgi:Na+-driven multidrug efflux pump